MKRGDLLWAALLCAILLTLVDPDARAAVVAATARHPYPMGFAKFAVLATLGELLSIRVVTGSWSAPKGPVWRAAIWGLIGAALVVLFPVFDAGVRAVVAKGLLPVGSDPTIAKVLTAFWISAVMNVAWAPVLMLGHRLTDTVLDLADGRLGRVPGVRLAAVVATVDWQRFLGFVVFKTIPLFWIPAHTLTFLLPAELRVLFAAFLSLALGALLSLSKRRGPAAGVASASGRGSMAA